MTLASATDQTAGAVKVTLSKDIINRMGKTYTDNFKAMLRQVPYNKDTENHDNYGYANYALMNVRAELDYIDASVTLRNPYDFPVIMTISGAEYGNRPTNPRPLQMTAPPVQSEPGGANAFCRITTGEQSSRAMRKTVL